MQILLWPLQACRCGLPSRLLGHLSTPECAGCEATVSPRTPALHLFCLTSSLKRSVTVPHLNLFALLQLRGISPAHRESFHGLLSAVLVHGPA
ncbi:unnamed protein product [Tetraodon nigroviridis]|uniref:(spotted green pufferfish) hypothetical protein n=1 Tax=Tetraodon nigroviridis TaxID=99883 RepID=Q4T1R4_TETNG|nr:unnamed protein product [Tetraodon nigroviridis]